MPKRSHTEMQDKNKKIENNNKSIMEKWRQRRQQQQSSSSSSYKTPDHPIIHVSQADANVSRKRRKKGKLEAPMAKRFHGDKILRRNPPEKRSKTPVSRALHKKQDHEDDLEERRIAIEKVRAANILLNLGQGTRKKHKKKGTKKKRKKKKRTKRTKKKHKKRKRKRKRTKRKH